VLLLAALALAWFGQELLGAPDSRLLGLGLMILAAAAFGAAAIVVRRAPRHAPVAGRGLGRLAGLPSSAALILLSMVAAIAAVWLASRTATHGAPALLGWGGSMALLLAGARLIPRAPAIETPTPYGRAEIALVVAITLAALLLRAVGLERIPANFGGDEGEMGIQAREVLRGERTDFFATGWLSHPMLWFQLQALSLRVFGDTVFGLRVLSAIIGAAAIPLLYVLTRPIYGRAIAAAAAVLLAGYHFHIHFSRLGVNNIFDPTLALAAFALLFAGYRSGAWLPFAAAGLVLGVSSHFYMGSRLTPLVVAAVLAHQAIFNWRRVWELRGQVAVMALGFLLGFGPLLHYYLLNPLDYTARLAMVGVFQTGWYDVRRAEGLSPYDIFAERAWSAFGAFVYEPDRSVWYNPGTALLDEGAAVLFVLGLAVVALRWRRPDAMLLLAWIAGTAVLGGVLMVNTESPRYVTTGPALCLVIALALHQIALLVRWALGLAPRFSYALLAASALIVSLWSVSFYFNDYTPRRLYAIGLTETTTAIGTHLNALPRGTFAYMVAPPVLYLGNGTIRFLAHDAPGADILDALTAPDQIPPPPEGVPVVFYVLPHRTAELEIIRQRYPDGELTTLWSEGEPGRELVLIYMPR
jgi:4-amino-4-deoxy-L-arabinose transferase-like glycosyltransferase